MIRRRPVKLPLDQKGLEAYIEHGALSILTERFLPSPDVLTPKGGVHLHAEHPSDGLWVSTLNAKDDRELRERFGALDIRGKTGYLVVAGESEDGRYVPTWRPYDAVGGPPDELREFILRRGQQNTGREMSRENLEIVRAAFAVVTIPGDPAAMIAASASTFEMHLVGVTGEPVYYAGASGIREWFRDVAHSWESFRFEATSLRDLDNRVLVLGDVRARGRGSGVEVDDRWGWIVELRDGRAISLHGFLDQGEALKAVQMPE